MSKNPLLHVRNLSVSYQTRLGMVDAVDSVSFEVNEGEIVGLVGESGSGKSTVGLSMIRLLPEPAGKIVSGEILLNDSNLVIKDHQAMQGIRGREIAMTFQDPMTYLNPVMRVGDQIVETIRSHQPVKVERAHEIALEWIANVHITEPERIFQAYPHQLSGGMRQRILLAIALSCDPQLIIADEPTTALDVTIQREIIDLMLSIRERFKTAILLITHDLGVVSEICDRVYVMYAGQIFEHAEIDDIILNPQNPYTQALLRSARSIDEYRETLYAIEGSAPSLINPPPGCRFRDRCPQALERCVEEPPTFLTEKGSWSKCWLHAEEEVYSVD